MLQEIQTLRDFIGDAKEDFKFMPLQVQSCLLFEKYEKDENGVSKKVVYVFDSGTCFIGKIENPHYIPERK